MRNLMGTLVLCLIFMSGCQSVDLAKAETDLREAMKMANATVIEAERAGADTSRTEAEISRIKVELVKVSSQAQKSAEQLSKAIIKVKETFMETTQERLRRDRAFASAERAMVMLKQTVLEIDQNKTSQMSEALAELKIEKRGLDEAFVRSERLRLQCSVVDEESTKAKEKLMKALGKMRIAMGDLERAKDRWQALKDE